MKNAKYFIFIITVVAVDALSKYFAKINNFIIVENPDLPFGISGSGFFNIGAVVVSLILFLFLYQKYFGKTGSLAWSLVVGGAVGNLLDRISDGRVTDFINVGIGTMNLADVAIWVGIIFLVAKSFKIPNYSNF